HNKWASVEASARRGTFPRRADASTLASYRPTRLKQPIQDRLHLERLQVRPQRQNARRDAGQVRRGPAGGRLGGKRAKVTAAVSQKLDLIARLVSELQRI